MAALRETGTFRQSPCTSSAQAPQSGNPCNGANPVGAENRASGAVRAGNRPESAASHNTAPDYDVRDPVLRVLLAVQARKLDNLGALYRIRRLVAEGWR